ncbi:MAG: 3-isopropylmalate dehydratase small subunit, partial [Nocardioides kribbensis]
KVVQKLWDLLEAQPGATVTVDLESRTVRAGEGPGAIEDSFDIDDYTRWRLLEGLDDIGITLGHADDITAYEQTRPRWKPATLHA